jgi:hypothetical protein
MVYNTIVDVHVHVYLPEIKKGAFDSQMQVIKLISFLPMVGGSLRLPPPLNLVAMI